MLRHSTSTPETRRYKRGSRSEWSDRVKQMVAENRLKAIVSESRGLRTIKIEGLCPSCNHGIVDQRPFTWPWNRPSSIQGRQYSVNMSCNCMAHHPGAAMRLGCGARFEITVGAS